MPNIVELEKQGWQALSKNQQTAQDFYISVLTDDAMMVFPGGMLLQGKKEILASIGAQPWNSYQLDDLQVSSLFDNTGIVVYRVTARREGSSIYRALISSLYVLNDQSEWKLALHQQTPV